MRHWILLRGLVREQKHWGDFPELLQNSLGTNNQLHCLDLKGMGTEAGHHFPKNMRDCVDDLRSRLHLQGLRKSRPIILSMSLGSMCAMEWAHLYPNELSGLVLINTSARNLAKPTDRLSLGAMKSFIKIIQIKDKLERERRILKLTSQFHKSNEDLTKFWASFAPELTDFLRVGLAQFWVASQYKAPNQISIPSLVLSSARDELANPICSANLAEKLNVKNHVHLGAGHDLTLDDPKWVIQKLQEWIQASYL